MATTTKILDAEEIATAVYALETAVRTKTVTDLLLDLGEWVSAGPDGSETRSAYHDDPDTWVAGFQAAIDFIKANYC